MQGLGFNITTATMAAVPNSSDGFKEPRARSAYRDGKLRERINKGTKCCAAGHHP